MKFRAPHFFSLVYVLMTLTLGGCNSTNTSPKQPVEGDQKTTKTKTLEEGAKLLQPTTPLGQIDIYLVGFHPMKDDPSVQMEAHHYCHQMNEDFAQCVLFDGNTKDAQLNGIEYIISEKLYKTLPSRERQYWHPHNYEILSGQLIAPNLPDAAEHALMAQKVNSYGKTWHVWMTDSQGKPVDRIPLGTPHLAWSFNHDEEAVPSLVEKRDRRLTVDSTKKRQDRADLASNAHAQAGVDELKHQFRNAHGAPGGFAISKQVPNDSAHR